MMLRPGSDDPQPGTSQWQETSTETRLGATLYISQARCQNKGKVAH